MDNPPLPEDKDASLVDPHHARFQRTDQWMPVYSWLESLDTDEVVKSKDILDWLLENPEIKEQLYSRHSRYHLMHYIKKCHVKILKRKEKKKGLQPSNKANYAQVHKTGATKLPVPVPYRVFDPSCSTQKVYVEGARDVALSAVNGINATIFAYGQTSSGKTFTMRGITENALRDIYDHIKSTPERDFVLRLSALEIYNETVVDLLNRESGPLRLLDDPEKGTIVEKLSEEAVNDCQHFNWYL